MPSRLSPTRRPPDPSPAMLNLLQARLEKRQHKRELRRYRDDGGDEALRFDYPLNPDDIVLDLGGYKGQWASDLYARYRCRIHVFEPVVRFAQAIETRFARNPDITTHPFGLGAANETIRIALVADASSMYECSAETEEAHIVDAVDWLERHGIGRVALAKLNIEGAEYDLLNHLIDAGRLADFNYLQIQFHNFAPDAVARMQSIHEHLQKTHRPQYQYRFVWESWVRRD